MQPDKAGLNMFTELCTKSAQVCVGAELGLINLTGFRQVGLAE